MDWTDAYTKRLDGYGWVSPSLIEAPGLDGILKELVRREKAQWPPPVNWCGFVG